MRAGIFVLLYQYSKWRKLASTCLLHNINIDIVSLFDTQYIHLYVSVAWSAHKLLISLSLYSFSKLRSRRAHIWSSHTVFCFWLHQYYSFVLLGFPAHFFMISVLNIYGILCLDIIACFNSLWTLWTDNLEQTNRD